MLSIPFTVGLCYDRDFSTSLWELILPDEIQCSHSKTVSDIALDILLHDPYHIARAVIRNAGLRIVQYHDVDDPTAISTGVLNFPGRGASNEVRRSGVYICHY